jgi:transcriptional regulator with XRE-family HTH domain
MTSDTGGDDPHRIQHSLYMQKTRGEIIKEARETKRLSQERLGELIGVTRSAVNQWESDNTVPKTAEKYQALADILGIDVAVLMRASGKRRRGVTSARTLVGHSMPALVVWRAIPGDGRRNGGFVVLHEQEDEVPRPEFLSSRQKAFAFKIVNEANVPVYKPRDTLVVDPDTPAIPGDDCLFADGIEHPAGSNVMVGFLDRITDALWIIKLYSSLKDEVELPRSEYPHAWPIVARYHRR